MLENYTNEHFADMQNDTDFLIALHQEVADLIAKNLGETMGQFAQKNYLSLLLYYSGGVIGEEFPEMSVSEIKKLVEVYRPRFHKLVKEIVHYLLKDFEDNCDEYMKIFELGIYHGQFVKEEP